MGGESADVDVVSLGFRALLCWRLLFRALLFWAVLFWDLLFRVLLFRFLLFCALLFWDLLFWALMVSALLLTLVASNIPTRVSLQCNSFLYIKLVIFVLLV